MYKRQVWELERGWITQGATLDELAANLAKSKWDDKMDADKLKASVERWNELVDKGVDEDFGREEMGKIDVYKRQVVNTRVHTPRFCGLPFRAGVLLLSTAFLRPLRTSWLMVGKASLLLPLACPRRLHTL